MSKNLVVGTIAAVAIVLVVGGLVFAGFQFFFGDQQVATPTPVAQATATPTIVVTVTATPQPTEAPTATQTSFWDISGGNEGLQPNPPTRVPRTPTAVVVQKEDGKCYVDLPTGKQEVPCFLTTPVVIGGGTPEPTEAPCTNPGGILCPATRTPAPNIVESVATRVTQAISPATPTPQPGPLEAAGNAVGGFLGWWCLIPIILGVLVFVGIKIRWISWSW